MLHKVIRSRQSRGAVPSGDVEFQALHPTIQRVLLNRGIVSKDDIDHRLKHLLTPDGLKCIDRAAERIAEAIESKQSILIVGDYDADGATSCALAIIGLQSMGAKRVTYAVPNRFSYGYGLSLKLAEDISKQAPDIIITVDNGISSLEGIAYLNQNNVDVIVTDHHLAGEQLPKAYAIVNPNQPGCGFKSKAIAGVGVMFYVVLAVNKLLRETGYLQKHNLKPDVLDLLDLVALGTVADVVSLDHNNRILVAQGIARMRAGRARPGIAALMHVANSDIRTVVAKDLGFVVGPRLNAAGRLEDISSGIECLLAQDSAQATKLAKELDEINRSRKVVESAMQTQALTAVQHLSLEDNPTTGLVLYNKAWHEGVVGLVASRMKDKTGVPVLVFAPGEDGLLKGSARSIVEVHIRDVLATIDAQYVGLIARFGGHAMAAGLSILPENLKAFRAAFEHVVSIALQACPPENAILTDGCLDEDELCKQFATTINTLIPWGQGCPEPLFEGEFEVLNSRFVGDVHLKLLLQVAGKNFAIDAIYFRCIDSPDSSQRREFLDLKRVKAAYMLDVNRYRGQESLQLIIRYLEVA